ncbi:MAG: hypothetical protein LRZ88_11935 [Candidatus Cloacimonetes bacterium]|nr:hypothetical protein [Candidatus Cloacimonadota bacterium]
MITTGPPHSSHLIGYRLKRETGIPWFTDFRDPWLDIHYLKLNPPCLLARMVHSYLQKKDSSRLKRQFHHLRSHRRGLA